jgi:chromosome segregation ATPase
MEELKLTLAEWTARVADLVAGNAALIESNRNLELDYQAKNEAHKLAREEADYWQEKCAHKDITIDAIRRDFEDRGNTIASLKKKLSAAIEETHHKDSRIYALKSDRRDHTDALVKKDNAIEALETDLGRRTTEVADLRSRVDDLERQLAAKGNSLRAEAKEREAAHRRIERQSGCIASLEEEACELVRQRDLAAAKVLEQAREIRKLKAQIEEGGAVYRLVQDIAGQDPLGALENLRDRLNAALDLGRQDED